MLRPADNDGEFQYRSNLRTPNNPDESVTSVLAGDDSEIHTLTVAADTLRVFRGIDTVHRVSPVTGAHSRVMAVLSCYE